ncbi:MAG: carbohydrate ABC transporter substrate-binding protein [Actinobacteria bacterium]|nr:carbohydrate ABC transporter substrate-binding protein [Actinomycetota bacterium]
MRTRRPRLSRRIALKAVLFGLLVAALVVPVAGYSGQSTAAQSGELEVFSWWTGGGEAAGLTKVIGIWKKENPSIKFVNAAVAGGAGTNAKAVLAQRLSANDPPDSFQGHAGAELQDYIKAGDLESIDSLYKSAGFGKFFPKSLVSQIRYRGKLYSVPVNIHRANVLWYNPKVLKDAGINKGQLKTWPQFVAALQKAKDAGVIPLAVAEQWTNKHLFETVLLATLGPAKYAALWKGTGSWTSAGVKTAVSRYQQLLTFTNSDAASLTWQDASKLVVDGKAAFNIMGDWANGYFTELKQKPNVGYGWAPVPGTAGVYQWLSDSFTLPKGAPNRAASIKWLTLLGSKRAQDAFNPVKGSIPARQDANPKLYNAYLKSALRDWKTNKLAGSLTHGVVASNAWNTAIDTALGQFLQSKNPTRFQSGLAAAAKKYR